MQERYVAPDLKLVGRADEVVLGSMRVGFDFDSEMMPPGMEFEKDDTITSPSQSSKLK